MKKTIAILILAVMLIGAFSSIALAHGGHGGRYYAPAAPAAPAVSYEICSIEGCTTLGLHEHDGTYYHCQSYALNGGYYHRNHGHGCGRAWY